MKGKIRIYNTLIFIGIALMVFSGYKIISIYKDYHDTNNMYQETAKEYVKEIRNDEDSEIVDEPESDDNEKDDNKKDDNKKSDNGVKWYNHVRVNLTDLKKENDDICGWIYFENEDISYPILYSEDNDTYIHTTYKGESAIAGSIFMEGKNNPDFSDVHTIIYGHNMRNLSMFGKLKYYKTKDDYYNDHKYFQIFTEKYVYRYRIISYKDVKADSNVYTVWNSGGEEFVKFINDNILSGSYIDFDGKVSDKDCIITLSTCSGDDNRLIVSAVRVAKKAL